MVLQSKKEVWRLQKTRPDIFLYSELNTDANARDKES